MVYKSIVIYIGHQVEKATKGSPVGAVHINHVIREISMGRVYSVARGWRVEGLRLYNVEAMDEKRVPNN